MYYFYLLRCSDGTLYAGSTNDVAAREQLHNSGKGSKYVLAHGGGVIVYSEQFNTRGEALKREAAVKRWPRGRKLALIEHIG